MIFKTVVLTCILLGICEWAIPQVEHGDKAFVTFRVRVTEVSDSTYRYNYTLLNADTSTQTFKGFRLFVGDPSVSTGVTPISGPTNKKWYFSGSSQGFFFGAAATRTLDLPPENGLAAGESMSLSYDSKGLPSIMLSYGEGWTEPVTDELFDSLVQLGYSDSQILLGWEDNSRISPTVSAQLPQFSLKPLAFLDTLCTFISRSRTLGWITTQPVADKYSGLFTRIKADVSIFNLKSARSRTDTVQQQVNIDSSSTLSSEAYALIEFNTEYLRDQLKPTNQVKAGIFNPTGGTISVKAKPLIAFGSGDTMKCIEATIRWLSSYNITLGTVSSPGYGFAKDGSVTTVGSYSYQKFRTTTSQPLSWTSGTEYELFTVPISGYCGVENFELTNALSGGEWFVNINYLDKTDSTFYQDTANGFAYLNKSSYTSALWHNGARPLAMTSTKLHEVYSSGGEIVYRRKSLTGGWEVTQRISPGNGAHNDPSVIIAHDGSLHVVWQRQLTSTTFSIWYSRSTDGGSSWVTADSIHAAGAVQINSAQWNVSPVMAERSTSQLVIVWCYGSNGYLGGTKYIISTNLGQSWGTVQTMSTSRPGAWYPSLASVPVNNTLMLTYDPRTTDTYSYKFDGTNWGSETNVSAGVGLYTNRHSSIAFDALEGHLYAAWCGQPSGHTEYVIAFRTGALNGTWGSPFVQFSIDSVGVSDYYPSITGWDSGDDNIDIIYYTSKNRVKLNQYSGGAWVSPRVLSNTGQWATITLQEQQSPNASGYPIRAWTDTSGGPYQVTLSTDGSYSLQMVRQQQVTPTFHRRVVVESAAKGSVIWFDLAPLKMVTTTGDTVVLPFTKLSPLKPFDATLANAWDYLGTDTLTLPSNASSLLLETDITSFAKLDSMGAKPANIFTSSTYQLDGLTAGKSVSLLASQPGVSGKTVVNVAQQAGKRIKLRMLGSVPVAAKEVVTVGVGDVYLTQNP